MVIRDEALVETAPAAPTAEPAAGQSRELAHTLAERGSEAGHYSILGPDPWRVLWNDERTGFVGFLEESRCVLGWRSPVATAAQQPELAERLVRYARDAGKPLIMAVVNQATAEAAERLGLHVSWIATECYLDLATWSLEGGRRQKVRWARSHAAHLGFSWREAFPLRDARDFDRLVHVEELWKSERPERRTDSFLRNSFTELAPWRRYFVCEGPDGVVASTTCTPINERGWYLQDPVRAPDAPRGALEGAMALALETFRDEGHAVASNGPLPFWGPGGATASTRPLGLMGGRVVDYFDYRYRFQHINQFRSKFVPDTTTPLFVARSHRLITPGVALSLTRLLTRPAPPLVDRPGAEAVRQS